MVVKGEHNVYLHCHLNWKSPISSLVKYPFKLFAHFSKIRLFISYYWVLGGLYIFWIRVQHMCYKDFFLVCAYFFIFLTVSFQEQKFTLIKSNYQLFLFCVFALCFKKYLPVPSWKIFSCVFFQKFCSFRFYIECLWPPKFIYWNLNSQWDGIRKWVFWKLIRL